HPLHHRTHCLDLNPLWCYPGEAGGQQSGGYNKGTKASRQSPSWKLPKTQLLLRKIVPAAFRRKLMLEDFSPHQQKIIKRYYKNEDSLHRQRLAELVGELFLAEGKKRQRAWA